jgi:hypothetical protein
MLENKRSGERRKFTRFEVDIPVQGKAVALGRKRVGRGAVSAIIKDISGNGIMLRWPAEFQLPQFLKLEIKILPTSEPIECIARTVWTKEKRLRGKGREQAPGLYDVGLSFVKDEYGKVPKLVSSGTNFYWDIFERTGYVEAYLLHKGIDKGCEEVPKDG